jgi:SAM-dependent methyltransferase
MTISQTEWPIAFFDDDYLKIYRPWLTAERTKLEVDFIERELELPKGARVLDLACGIGRHAVEMAARGYAVTGVDFNPSYLEVGRQTAAAREVAVAWQSGDMRAIEFARAFDAVYSYFTSFGYYSDDQNETVLERVAAALVPKGRLLIDLLNRDHVLTHPLQRTWHQREDGALLMEENALDLASSRVTSRQILIEPGTGSHVVKEFDLRAYTCAELTALLRRHGMTVTRVLGGPDASEFSTESRRLVIVAQRDPS